MRRRADEKAKEKEKIPTVIEIIDSTPQTSDAGFDVLNIEAD